MVETWVECSFRVANPYEQCRVGGFSWVSREDCASCPVPKMAAALEGVRNADAASCVCNHGEGVWEEANKAVMVALALYRKRGNP
jgi:hypothetical protein